MNSARTPLAFLFAILFAGQALPCLAWEVHLPVLTRDQELAVLDQAAAAHLKALQAARKPPPPKPKWERDRREAEVFLRVKYFVKCKGDMPGLVGQAFYQGRLLRVLLFEGLFQTEVALGSAPSLPTDIEVKVNSTPDCELQNPEAELDYTFPQIDLAQPTSLDYDYLALKYSPFLVARTGQDLDQVPMLLAYKEEEEDGLISLAYAAAFSDSDARKKPEDVKQAVIDTGVASDIEWLYKVKLTVDGKVISRSYHAANGDSRILPGPVNHDDPAFLPASEHPVLQLADNANLMEPGRLSSSTDGFHLVPRVVGESRFQSKDERDQPKITMNRFSFPSARASLLLEQPWTLRVTDLELKRSDRLPVWGSTAGSKPLYAVDYLYVLINGILDSGLLKHDSLRATLALRSPGGTDIYFESAPSGDGIEILGDGVWDRESFIAIPIGEENLRKIREGEREGTLHLLLAMDPDHLHLKNGGPRFLEITRDGDSYAGFRSHPLDQNGIPRDNEVTRRFHQNEQNSLKWDLIPDPSNP